MTASLFARRRALRTCRTHRPGNARSRQARLAIDRLESRIALAIDTLSIGGATVGSFIDFTGDQVLVSITGSAGTAVFRNADGGIVVDGDNIASIAITGASPDFQLTVGAVLGVTTTGIGPLNGVETVYLGRVTADSVIRGINTVGSVGFTDTGIPSVAISDNTRFSLESFVGVDFSKGGGLFVDVVTGGEGNVGVLLSKGFNPSSTIAIREQLDAVVILGAGNKGTADGRLLIESATDDSLILVGKPGDTAANSKLQILGGEGPFDAGVAFRGRFAGTVNLQTPAGGTWLFEGDVAPSAVLKAANWNGLTVGDDLPRGVVARRTFAGTLDSADGDASLTVGGAVKGTARINSGGEVSLDAQSVEAGAEINAERNVTLDVARNFAGRVSADTVRATVGGNLAGGTMTGGSSVELAVTGSIINATLAGRYGVSGAVGGNISKSTLRAGTDAVDLDIGGNIVNSRLISREDIRCRIDGSVSGSEFTSATKAVSLAVKGTMTASLVDAYDNVSLDVDGTISKSKIFYGTWAGFESRPDLLLDVGGDLLQSDVVGRDASSEGTVVNVARDARGVRFASRDSARGDRQYTIGRNFQGSIQGARADVFLDVGGSVEKGSSLATGGNAAVNVARNFDGVVEVRDLQFRVAGNVSKESRIVANRVWQWFEPEVEALSHSPNFLIGGRLDGIVNVGVFDAYDGNVTVTIIGGGAGSSARFYVGRFETDAIEFRGNFEGNVRVLQDLVADLTFTGNVSRITIGGQVFTDITVGGTLLSLNSNSWFRPTGAGKRTGNFIDGGLVTTGTLTTGKYVTVAPVAPPVG